MKILATARKKVLLFVMSFLAVLSFGIALCCSIVPTVNAGGGVFSVTSVRQTYVETYNDASDGKGYRSNFVVTFNSAVFSEESSFEAGDDVTTYLTENSNFADKVTFNYSTIATINASASEKITFYKVSDNSIELQVNRPLLWANIKFDSGLELNGKTLDETVTFYEKSDWTFSTTAPTERKVVGLAERPYVDSSYSLVLLQFNFQLTDGIRAQYDKILYKNSTETVATGHDAAAGGGDIAGELVCGSTVINLYFTLSRFGEPNNAYYTEITFEEGLGGTDTETTFFCAAGVNHSNWYAKPVWAEKKNTVAIESVTQTTADALSHYSEYEIKFKNIVDDSKDVFANREIGENLTSDFLHNYVQDKFSFNDMQLGQINSNKDVTVTKSAANTIKLKISCCINYAKIDIRSGLKNAGYMVLNGATYYQNEMLTPSANATFTARETAPDFKIFGIYAIASGDYPNSVYFKMVFNSSLGNNASGNTNLDLTGVLLNGEQLYNGTSLIMSPAGEVAYNGTQYNITINNIHGSELPSIITFPKGWSMNERGTLAETVEFAAIDDNNYSYGEMPLPVWKKLQAQTVSYKLGETVIKTESATSITLADPSDIEGYNSQKTFIGWKNNGKLYKSGETVRGLTQATEFTVVEIGDFETIGAEIRVSGSAGIRFVTTYNTADLAANSACFGEMGTLIARAADLSVNKESLNVETADIETSKSIIVKIVNTDGGKTVSGNVTEMRGGIYNMKEHNFDVELVSCGYIAVNYASGVDYVYTTSITRTAKNVAQAVIDSGTCSDDAEAMKLLNAYVGNDGTEE